MWQVYAGQPAQTATETMVKLPENWYSELVETVKQAENQANTKRA